MNPYSSKADELLLNLQTNAEKGLSPDNVERLLKEHGENRLKEGKKKTNLQRFLDQFKDEF